MTTEQITEMLERAANSITTPTPIEIDSALWEAFAPDRANHPRHEMCAGTCGRPIRGPRETADAALGTVKESAFGLCSSCYRDFHDPTRKTVTRRFITVGTPCDGGCGYLLRTRTVGVDEAPEMRLHYSTGMCRPCHQKTRL